MNLHMMSRKTPIFGYFPKTSIKDCWATIVRDLGPFVITWQRLDEGRSQWARLWIGW
jgi:hypothetical protein